MKIIEALKKLPTLEKRIIKNIEQIRLYSSAVDNGNMDLPFGTEEGQKKEVSSLVQSVNDLVAERSRLRRSLAITNAKTFIKIGTLEKSITEWIEYREKGLGFIIDSQSALNISVSEGKVRTGGVALDPEKGFKIVRFFDEKTRNNRIEELRDIQDRIDAELEKVNAVTDIIEV